MDGADHCHAVLGLRVVDGVPAGDQATGRAGDGRATVEHLCQQLERQVLPRPRHQVQREQGSAAHGIHVGQRVRRRDAAPVVGIVDDRGEEVRGHHDREIVA